MQLTFRPLQNAQPLSAPQRAAIQQVLAMFAPTIFLVPVTIHLLHGRSVTAIDKGATSCNR